MLRRRRSEESDGFNGLPNNLKENTIGRAGARTGTSATDDEMGKRIAEKEYPSGILVGTCT
jgi:hypothetical protein